MPVAQARANIIIFIFYLWLFVDMLLFTTNNIHYCYWQITQSFICDVMRKSAASPSLFPMN